MDQRDLNLTHTVKRNLGLSGNGDLMVVRLACGGARSAMLLLPLFYRHRVEVVV